LSVAEAPEADPRRPARARETWTNSPLGRFVARQRSGPVTQWQVAWDVVVGAVLPVILVWLDRYWDPLTDGGLLRGRVYVMLLASLGAAAVVAFHVCRTRAPKVAAATAGPLRLTGWIAIGVGLLLLPLSLIGIFIGGIGLLGFLPFVIGFLHLRCGVRARRLSDERLGDGGARWMQIAMALAVLAVAAVGGKGAKILAYRDQGVLLGERRGNETGALWRLRVLWHFPGVPLSRLRWELRHDTEEAYERVDDLHRRITGRRHTWSDAS